MDDCTFESSFRKVSHPPQPFHLRPILASRVFCVVEGYLVSSECQTLGNPETVLGRKSVYPYNVLSCRYYFKNAQFYLNQINLKRDLKYIQSGLPFSKMRVAVHSGLSNWLAAGAIAALMYLA